VWEHQRSFGRGYYHVQQQHASLLRSPITHLRRQLAGVLLIAIPLLACKDMLLLYWQSREMRRYAHAFWGMAWGRIAWYFGVSEALIAHPAAIESTKVG
jgi:hypothetical protein